LELAGVVAAQGGNAFDEFEPGEGGAFGVALMGGEVSEIGDDSLALELGDVAAGCLDDVEQQS